jgi:DNA-3-methyladenine glycosylase II
MELNLMSTSIIRLVFVRDDLDGAGGVTVCDGAVTPAGGVGAEQIRRVRARGPAAFGTPYEATAWSILSARGPQARADALWRALVAEHGEAVDLGDAEPRRAFPLPRTVLGLTDLPGVPAEKLWRLHDVAEAALNGLLDATALAALPEDEALAQLKGLRGIGDFYAELILDRAVRPSRDDSWPPGDHLSSLDDAASGTSA